MQPSLRVARVDVSGYRLLTDDFTGLGAIHRELQTAIRRHLPGVTASVLALPVPAVDGKTVDWYSDLSGQPVALAALPAERRAFVKAKLKDRLASLQRLADELPARVPGSESLAQSIRCATHYPDDTHVYAVGDEPVLTLWGFVLREGRGHGGAIATAAGTGAAGGRRYTPWIWGLALVFALAFAGGGWYWFEQQRLQSLETELARVIAVGCTEPDLAKALESRLDRLDPQRDDFAEIRQRLAAEQSRCAAGAALAEDIAGAKWDCARLEALRQGMADQDSAREPFAGMAARLDDRIGICTDVASYLTRLEQTPGDCALVAELDRELGAPPAEAQPLTQARERIDLELASCAAADRLGDALSANLGHCEELYKIDGQLGALDASRPPLAPIRERMDSELALCSKAATYRQALVDAQMDCARLRTLDQDMAGEDTSREPLESIRVRLDAALEQCKALKKLEQSLNDSGQDCDALAALSERMGGLPPENPIFVPFRRRVAERSRICDIAQQLRASLAAAEGDCTALDRFAVQLDAQPALGVDLGPIRTKLAAERGLCEAADRWRERIRAAGGACPKLRALGVELNRADAKAAQFRDIRRELDAASERCRSTAVAQAKRETKRATTSETKREIDSETKERPRAERRRLCPGIRKLEEAPQLAMVFDASGSMGMGMDAGSAYQEAVQALGNPLLGLAVGALGMLGSGGGPSGPTRMQVAKQAGSRIIKELPRDVDVGLIKIENCPGATNAGFYSPAQRGQLLSRIGAMVPRDKTPLASAIRQAADMLDGVTRPGVIVVISDGRDTCGGDPCSEARRIAARKPKLRVNVIDIMGNGAGRCVAAATGGKVFPANNAEQLNSMLRRATQEVRGPAECGPD